MESECGMDSSCLRGNRAKVSPAASRRRPRAGWGLHRGTPNSGHPSESSCHQNLSGDTDQHRGQHHIWAPRRWRLFRGFPHPRWLWETCCLFSGPSRSPWRPPPRQLRWPRTGRWCCWCCWSAVPKRHWLSKRTQSSGFSWSSLGDVNQPSERLTSLESSDDHVLVVMIRSLGTQCSYTEQSARMAAWPSAVSSPPIRTRSGSFRSFTAVPSARNSGLDRT